MSRTREEKLAEDLDPETRENIEEQYDLIEQIEDLEANDIVVVETHDGIRFAGEVINHGPVAGDRNYKVDVQVLAYDGPDFAEDDLGFIHVDRIGASGSVGDWKGVAYTTAFPNVGHQDSWGDVETLAVRNDADEAIEEVTDS